MKVVLSESGEIRKNVKSQLSLKASELVIISTIFKKHPVIYTSLLKDDDPYFYNELLKFTSCVHLPRWKDADAYTKRLFSNLALHDSGSPLAMTLNLKSSFTYGMEDPEIRKKNINNIRDEIVRKLKALGEDPLVWFVLESVPYFHVHGAVVLKHTKPEDFRHSIRCLRACYSSALQVPAQITSTKRYGVDSRYSWVLYTSKCKRHESFDSVISQQLNKKAREFYEVFRENRRRANQIRSKA